MAFAPRALCISALLAGLSCFVAPLQAAQIDIKLLGEPLGELPAVKSREDAHFQALLQRRFDVTIVEVPLRDFAAYLGELIKLDVRLDRRHLSEMGRGEDLPLSLQAKNITLEMLLKLVFRECELGWVIRDERLVITSEFRQRVTRVFDVRDLRGLRLDPDTTLTDWLVPWIQTHVLRTDRDESEGPAGIRIANDLLSIHLRPDSISEVADLLRQLRAAQKIAATWDGKSPFALSLAPPESAETTRIKQALEKILAVEYVEVPLEEVVRDLSEKSGVTIILDGPELRRAGIEMDAPITFRAGKRSLRATLRTMLAGYNLGFVTANEIVLISSPDVCQCTLGSEEYFIDGVLASYTGCKLATVVYPVPDFVTSAATAQDELDELADAVKGTLNESTWEGYFDQGNIRGIAPLRALVVNQSPELHEKLVQLLAQLRKARAERPPGEAAPPIQPVTVNYPLVPSKQDPSRPIVAQAELLDLLKTFVDPATDWNGPKSPYLLRIYANQLVVRHTPAMQRRIAKMLAKLDFLDKTKSEPTPAK